LREHQVKVVDTFSEGEERDEEESFLGPHTVIDEPVKNLSTELARVDKVDIDTVRDEGKVRSVRGAGIRGDNCEVWRGGRLLHRKILAW
jgi:hypothetical protein